jgi:HPt (histidine-containing phosphotransfer) domain-containing protein
MSNAMQHDSGQPMTWDTEGLVRRLGGDATLAAECTEIFCLDAARRLSALRADCIAGDLDAVVRQLHSLKGAAGTAGADAFQAAAGIAEQEAHAGELRSVGALIPTMEEELARLRAAVLAFLAAA